MNNRKKYSLLIAEDFPPSVGGIQTMLYQIANNYNKQMIVIAPSCEEAEKFDSRQTFQIIRKETFPDVSFFNNIVCRIVDRFFAGVGPAIVFARQWFPTMFLLVIKKKVKTVHCGQIKCGLIGYLSKLFFKKPYFVYAHGVEILSPIKRKLKYKKRFYSFILKNANLVITNSNNTKKILLQYDIPLKKIFTVPLGADLKKFNPNLNPTELIKRHNLYGKKLILSVGHLVKRKGFDYVLKSLPTVLENVKDAFYVIVGEGEDKSRLKTLVKDLKIEKNVLFAGKVSEEELPYYYAMSDVFVMLSRELRSGDIEGFGIVFVEANACGKPVIGGRSGGIEDAVLDGETGLLVNPTDTEEISKGIIKLLTDREYAERLGEKGRKRAEKEFNWKNTARFIERIETIY